MTTFGRSFVLGALLLSVAGCASVTRDTWSGANDQLQQTHLACLATANSDTLGGTAVGGGGLVGRAVRRSFYKDCMEERGYTKTRSEESAPVAGGVCGAPNQTCTTDPSAVNPFGYRRAY